MSKWCVFIEFPFLQYIAHGNFYNQTVNRMAVGHSRLWPHPFPEIRFQPSEQKFVSLGVFIFIYAYNYKQNSLLLFIIIYTLYTNSLPTFQVSLFYRTPLTIYSLIKHGKTLA